MSKKINDYQANTRFLFGMGEQKKEFKLKSVGKRKVKFAYLNFLGSIVTKRDTISKVNEWLRLGILQEIKTADAEKLVE